MEMTEAAECVGLLARPVSLTRHSLAAKPSVADAAVAEVPIAIGVRGRVVLLKEMFNMR